MADAQPVLRDPATRAALGRIARPRLRTVAATVLGRVLYPHEHLRHVEEGFEEPSKRDRTLLGAAWPWLGRVVVVVTDLRVLELAVRPGGRSFDGRVRSFPWYRVHQIAVAGDRLALTPRTGPGVTWVLRSGIGLTLLQQLRRAAAPLAEGFGDRVCDQCGVATFTQVGTCSSCRRRPVDPDAMASLAWFLPGGGLLATGHRMLGLGRIGLELAAWGLAAFGVLSAGSLVMRVAVCLGAAAVLPWVKGESARMSRRIAARTGCTNDPERWSWRRLRVPGLVFTALLLVAPWPWAGHLSSAISADLDFVAPAAGWTGSRRCSDWPDGCVDPSARSRWVHPDGWTVLVTARPLAPTETPAGLLRRLAETGWVVERLEIGPLLVLAARGEGGGGEVDLRFQVIDRSGRDVHTLATQSPAHDAEARTDAIENLLMRGIWIDPVGPVAGTSGNGGGLE